MQSIVRTIVACAVTTLASQTSAQSLPHDGAPTSNDTRAAAQALAEKFAGGATAPSEAHDVAPTVTQDDIEEPSIFAAISESARPVSDHAADTAQARAERRKQRAAEARKTRVAKAKNASDAFTTTVNETPKAPNAPKPVEQNALAKIFNPFLWNWPTAGATGSAPPGATEPQSSLQDNMP